MAKNIILSLLVMSLCFGFVFVLDFNEASQKVVDTNLVSAMLLPTQAPQINQSVLSATSDNSANRKTFTSRNKSYSLQLPVEYSAKQIGDTLNITFQLPGGQDQTLIQIRERILNENDTIQTVSEKDINEKLEQIPSKAQVVETITPVAIGSITAITYKLREDEKDNSYFYLPMRQNRFIEIAILNENTFDSEAINTIDRIVYSVEVL